MSEATAIQTIEPAVPAEVEPASQSAAIIQVIERAALNPDIDVEKMERLLAMQERIVDREAKQEFAEAKRQAQMEMATQPIVKASRNPETRSTYADLSAVLQVVTPIYTNHGFSMSFGTADSPLEKHYRVLCDLSHSGGHTERYQLDIPLDNVGPKGTQNKTATHGFGSSMTYGRRYLTLLIWNIATLDDDGSSAGAGTITEEQVETLKGLLDKLGVRPDSTQVMNWLEVDRLEDLPAKRFRATEAALHQRIKLEIEDE